MTNEYLKEYWEKRLEHYPPMLRPKQVERGTDGILTANAIYKRNSTDREPLPLRAVRMRGRVFVMKDDVIDFLCGQQEREI